MNRKLQCAIAWILGLSLALGVMTLVNYHARIMDAHHNEIWRLNWEPSIGNLRINGTIYYIVCLGDDPEFATTNMAEATEWAMNFTKEWGWLWKP